MNHILRILAAMTLLLTWSSGVAADGDFNPSNPPDPQPMYIIKVGATPAQYAYASGSGMFAKGARVYISSSSRDTDYEFKYWEKNGERISGSENFYYTVEESNVTFNAVFGLKDFNPSNPADPNFSYKYPLNLVASPAEACSFNRTSGERVLPGTWVTVTAYASQGFVFLGWYDDDELVSTSTTFNYEMPNGVATLKACFKFDPSNPLDPSSSGNQEDVSNVSRSDVNGDNVVDVSDAAMVINWFLNKLEYNLKYDMNIDNAIDVSDSTHIINTYLNSKRNEQ